MNSWVLTAVASWGSEDHPGGEVIGQGMAERASSMGQARTRTLHSTMKDFIHCWIFVMQCDSLPGQGIGVWLIELVHRALIGFRQVATT